MENPATRAPGSGPTLAPEAARLAFRARRKAAGFTQAGLARAAGLSSTYVKKLELGRLQHPTRATRDALAEALGVSADVLFEGFATLAGTDRHALVRSLRADGWTMPEIADKLECSTTTIWRIVHELELETRMGPAPKYPPPPSDRICAYCGDPVLFRAPYHASGTRGQFCSRECFREHVKTGAIVVCPMCGKGRYRSASHLRKKCCGYRCASRYRWQVSRAGLRRFVASRRSGRGRWSGLSRQVWGGRLGGAKAPGVDARPRGKPRGYTDAQVKTARIVLERDPRIGRDRLARLLRVSPKQASAILEDLKG
jgi:DNA-binding XRE family transcriptional regulator